MNRRSTESGLDEHRLTVRTEDEVDGHGLCVGHSCQANVAQVSEFPFPPNHHSDTARSQRGADSLLIRASKLQSVLKGKMWSTMKIQKEVESPAGLHDSHVRLPNLPSEQVTS